MTQQTKKLRHEAIKDKQRKTRAGFPEGVGLRIHRAISWLGRAEVETKDRDAAFIFYWIAFNAAYADDRPSTFVSSEKSGFEDYFKKLIALDKDNRIYGEIWNRFPDSIRMIFENKYVFQRFWHHHNHLDGFADWEERFSKSKKRLHTALRNRDTQVILTTLFDRLYVLRNQMIHGGATWNSKVNRKQVADGANILSFLIPIFIDLMMDNPSIDWGAPYYPVVEE